MFLFEKNYEAFRGKVKEMGYAMLLAYKGKRDTKKFFFFFLSI